MIVIGDRTPQSLNAARAEGAAPGWGLKSD